MGLSFAGVHAHLLCCISLFKLFLPTSVCVRLAAPRRQTDGHGAEERGEVAVTTRFGMRAGGRWGWVRAQAPQTLWSRRAPFFFPQTFYEADPCRRRQERAPRQPRATTSWKHFFTCYKWSFWSPRALTLTCIIKVFGLHGNKVRSMWKTINLLSPGEKRALLALLFRVIARHRCWNKRIRTGGCRPINTQRRHHWLLYS